MTTSSEDHSSSNGDDSSSYKFSSSKLKKKGKKIKLRADQPLKSGNAHKSASPSSSSSASASASSASSKEKEMERHSSKDRKTDETPSSPVQKYIKMFENNQTSSTKPSPSASATQATRTGLDTTPKPTARTPERSKASSSSSSSSRGPNTPSERRKKSQASPSSSSSSSSSPSYSPRSTSSSHPSSPSSRSSKQNSSSTSSSSNRKQKTRRKTSPQEQKYPSKIPKRGNNDQKKTTTAGKRVKNDTRSKTYYRDNDDHGGGGAVGGDDMDWSEYVSEPLSAPAKIDTPPSPSASSADRAAGGGRQAAAAAAVQVQLLDQKLGDLMVQHEDLRGSMMSPSSTRRNKNRPWHKEYTEASKAARSEKRVQRSSDSLSRSLHSGSYSSDSIRSMRSALSGTGLDVVMREVSDSDSGKSGSISSKSGLSNGSNSSSSSDDSEGRRTKGVYDRYRKYLNKDGSNKATPEKQTEDFQRLSTKLSAPPQLDFTYRYQGESTNVVEMKHVSNEVTAEQAASVMRKPSRSNTADLSEKLARLDRHLQSDALPKDDLKMLGALLLQDSQSHMSFDDSTLGSDVHSHRTSERSAMRTQIGDPTSRMSSASLSDSLDPLVIEEDREGEMSNRSSSNGGDDQIGQTSAVKAEKSFKEIYRDDEDEVTGSADNDHQFANASHLEGLNQPMASEEDSGSIGSDLFDAPKKVVTDKPLLAAAKKAKEQNEGPQAASHLEGMNQPLASEEDSGSIGSDLFDAPKKVVTDKPLLAAAKKAKQQNEGPGAGSHLEGMNQPKAMDEDSGSIGSDLFDAPKKVVTDKPLLAAAKKAKEQNEGPQAASHLAGLNQPRQSEEDSGSIGSDLFDAPKKVVTDKPLLAAAKKAKQQNEGPGAGSHLEGMNQPKAMDEDSGSIGSDLFDAPKKVVTDKPLLAAAKKAKEQNEASQSQVNPQAGSHLAGLNQPRQSEEDSGSIGSDLFDAPKQVVTDKPLLAAAKKAKEQNEGPQAASHLEGLNQPRQSEEDSGSIGSDLFDAPKKVVTDKPLLAAAKKAKQQNEGPGAGSHLEGMNQPKAMDEDSGSIGSDLFDAPKKVVTDKPLLAAAKKAKEQNEGPQAASHLEGLNQPRQSEEDSGSIGSDLFDAPKKVVTDKPLLAAAKKAKEQNEASQSQVNPQAGSHLAGLNQPRQSEEDSGSIGSDLFDAPKKVVTDKPLLAAAKKAKEQNEASQSEADTGAKAGSQLEGLNQPKITEKDSGSIGSDLFDAPKKSGTDKPPLAAAEKAKEQNETSQPGSYSTQLLSVIHQFNKDNTSEVEERRSLKTSTGSNVEGLNQPKITEKDSGSIGSDLFDAPNKGGTDKPRLAAAEKAKEQNETSQPGSYSTQLLSVIHQFNKDNTSEVEERRRSLKTSNKRAVNMTGVVHAAGADPDDIEIVNDLDLDDDDSSCIDVVDDDEEGVDQSDRRHGSLRNTSSTLPEVQEEDEDSEGSNDSFSMWQKTLEAEKNSPPPSLRGLDDSKNSSQSLSEYASLNNNDESMSLGGSWQNARSTKKREKGVPASPTTSSLSLDTLELQNSLPKSTKERSDKKHESSLSDFVSKKSAVSIEKDDQSMDGFSLIASDDVGSLQSISERQEYDHKLSKKNAREEDMMNVGIQNLHASILDDDDESFQGDLERGVDASTTNGDDASTTNRSRIEHSEKKEVKESGIAPIPKPRESYGIWRYLVYGLVLLLVVAAIVLPLYFLVWSDDANDNANSGNNTGPILPVPTLPPVGSPTLSPTLSAPSPAPTSPPITSPVLPPTNVPLPGVPTVEPADLASFLISKWPPLEEDFQDPNSPQSLAYEWLLNDPGLDSFDDARIVQRFSLAVFYYSTDGANWQRNERWLSTENECLWYTSSSTLPCDGELRYTSVDLDFNNLSGTIASELGLLSNTLTRLDLSGNGVGLTGSVPTLLGFLTMLTSINFSRNALQGPIPSAAGKWNKIQQVDLSMNDLTGQLPQSIGIWTDLTFMNLKENRLGGSLPSMIGSLTNLKTLDLDDNLFTGAVPAELGEGAVFLEDFFLSNNQFTSLPDQIGNLVSLRQMSVDNNQLVGTLTSQIGNLVNLLSLNLSGNSLSGPLPTQLGQITSLRDELDLSQNNFEGPIPAELGNLSILRNLLLYDNRLTGTVPDSFSQLVQISTLRLEDNDLTGTVSEEVCAVYDQTFPIFVTDCLEEGAGGIDCPCCMFCCDSVSGRCECQYEGTDLDFLCEQSIPSSGIADRMVPTV